MKFPIKQVYTVAAENLTGHASVTGDAWVIGTANAGDGLAHQVTIKNNSVTDHSAKTIVLTGSDARGNAQTETLAAPGASATVTSTKLWGWLNTATPSVTIGADTFDIGWAAAAVSPWVDLEYYRKDFAVSVAVVASGTINYDVEHTYDTDLSGAEPFKHSLLQSKTASDDGQYAYPVTAVRVRVNSHTSGKVAFSVLQGER